MAPRINVVNHGSDSSQQKGRPKPPLSLVGLGDLLRAGELEQRQEDLRRLLAVAVRSEPYCHQRCLQGNVAEAMASEAENVLRRSFWFGFNAVFRAAPRAPMLAQQAGDALSDGNAFVAILKLPCDNF
jgi:hypothetical protein